jgi:(p)ppGpp synthase/HD superfamily hydrolase
MIYTAATKKAMNICFSAHKDQLDKSGQPYVFHPFHLADQMESETTTIVALLHDVLEDSSYTEADLREEGFSDEVMDALLLLTHEDGVDYLEYVKKIKSNPIAKAVKIADLTHNSDLSRLDNIDEKALKRRNTYLEALALLSE